MPAIDKLLVDIATNASTAKRFRENPLSVIKTSDLTDLEESVLLSRDARLIQSTLQASALKNSLAAAADETVWTVVVVI